MKRLVIGLGLLLAGGIAQAADITWGSAAAYSDAGDIVTDGYLVEAINACGVDSMYSPEINGVQFTADTGLMSGDATTTFLSGDTGDDGYNNLLNTLDYGSSSFQIGDGQLEAGKAYLVQFWYCDERSSGGDRSMTFSDESGNESPWVDDGHVTGTFTADGSAQSITVKGYNNSDSSSATVHVNGYQIRDLSSPIPTLSTTAGDTVTGDFDVTVSFSEEVSGLTADDFEVTNGTASEVSGSGTSWTVTILPAGNGDVTVSLPAGTVAGLDGFFNVAGNTVLTIYIAPGSEQPVPTLSTATNNVTEAFTVQVDFSEPVTGLELSGFAVTNGTASALTGSGASYELTVTPTFGGDVTVVLPRNTVTDVDDGLQNTASDVLVTAYHINVTVDSLAELQTYLPQDNVTCTLTPGTYTITGGDIEAGEFESYLSLLGRNHKVLLKFSGSNSTYEFTNVVLQVDSSVWTQSWDGHGNGVYQINITGNSNVLKNLTMVDVADEEDYPVDGACNIVMDGSYNRIEGFDMTIKGSYPYGYGDCFGKGGSWTIKHYKHSAFLIRGESNHAKNCSLLHHSYGHGMFMQAASNPTIEGCYVEGEIRTTDDMLAETSGPAYDIDFMTVWGYTLPAGYMKSLAEAGIRAYNAGETVIDGVEYDRGTSNPTIINNTVKNMRVGVTLTHASGTKYVSGCTTIGTERGYAIGSGIIENCYSDVQYGPAFGVDYDSDSGVTADITIIPYEGDHYNGSRHFAYIFGSDHNLTFRGMEENVDQDLEINVGGDLRIESSYDTVEDRGADSIIINNYTGYPLILDDASTDNTGFSSGTISDAGTGNSFTAVDWSVTSNITFYGTATQSSTSYDALASLAIDQNTSGQFGEGSVTHTANEDQPWWQVDLESPCEISDINIWGRTDTAQSRLSNYDVTIYNSEGRSVWTSYQSSYPDPMVSLDTGSVVGQVVRVQLRGSERLSLAEVEIFGSVIEGPDGLTAAANASEVILSWNTVAGADSYTVKRATVSGGPYTTLGTTADTNYTDSGVINGELYYYVVTAAIDGSESSPSDEVSAMVGSAPEKFDVGTDAVTASEFQDPNAPANTVDGDLGTRWSANGDGQWIRYDLGEEKYVHALELAWLNGASRQSIYQIETSSDGTTWTALTDLLYSSGTTTNLETVEVTATLARYVRIVGYGNTANTWNSITEVEIWGTLASSPAVPAGLAASSGDGQITLGWTASDGATAHHLKRSVSSGTGYVTIASQSGTGYLDTNVVNGTVYYYVVSAENAVGESDNSAEVSAVPSAAIIPEEVVIASVAISAGGSDSTLSFTNSVLGHNYRVLGASDLVDPDWQVVSATNAGSGGLLEIELIDETAQTNRYYKLQTWRQ